MLVSDICSHYTKSCESFSKIDTQILELIASHYYDLQMYSIHIANIDNSANKISNKYNFSTLIDKTKNSYKKSEIPLFEHDNMIKLRNLVSKMFGNLQDIFIKSKKYAQDLTDIEFFGSGDLSLSILLRARRKIDENTVTSPFIIKLTPLNMSHHYSSIHYDDEFIQTYIISPSYAIFIKEAWMYCFSKTKLSQYTPTFACISNCYILNGFPLDLQSLSKIFVSYAEQRTRENKYIPYKKWFNILMDATSNKRTKQTIMEEAYGCFEIKQVNGTLEDLINVPQSLNLSIIFEYLYTKIVAAFVGRVIFTDDHIGNIGYINVDYARQYTIKCNGCNYNFYMPPGKMVQFIDLERYVFNFSKYEIYTNDALKEDAKNHNNNFTKKSYYKNSYIGDKTISLFIGKREMNKSLFETSEEYDIMLRILTSKFIHDIKTFCQIMYYNLPKTYLTKPENVDIDTYQIDLDDQNNRYFEQF